MTTGAPSWSWTSGTQPLGALFMIKGSASHEMEQSSARAMELCQRPGINWKKTWCGTLWESVSST